MIVFFLNFNLFLKFDHFSSGYFGHGHDGQYAAMTIQSTASAITKETTASSVQNLKEQIR